MVAAPQQRQETEMRLGIAAVVAVALFGSPGCAFCPAGLAPTAADTAAGLACHFTPEQQILSEQREEGWRHPPGISW